MSGIDFNKAKKITLLLETIRCTWLFSIKELVKFTGLNEQTARSIIKQLPYVKKVKIPGYGGYYIRSEKTMAKFHMVIQRKWKDKVKDKKRIIKENKLSKLLTFFDINLRNV